MIYLSVSLSLLLLHYLFVPGSWFIFFFFYLFTLLKANYLHVNKCYHKVWACYPHRDIVAPCSPQFKVRQSKPDLHFTTHDCTPPYCLLDPLIIPVCFINLSCHRDVLLRRLHALSISISLPAVFLVDELIVVKCQLIAHSLCIFSLG